MEIDNYELSPDGPQRFRDLNEVYENAPVVELEPKSEKNDEVEIAALLAAMEEPSCFRDAVDHPEWVQAMDSEMQSSARMEHGS
jgi:hypothetical protein